VRLSPRRQVAFGTIALVLGACAAAPLFLSNYPLFVLSLTIVNAIAVLGVNLVMGYAGQISLGHAGFAAIGAYATALLVVNLEVSYWLALPVGALLAAVCGYILGLPALRLGPLYVSMVTFGFGLIVVIIVQNWYELAAAEPIWTGAVSSRISHRHPCDRRRAVSAGAQHRRFEVRPRIPRHSRKRTSR
jgi:ABC-type branched-subunit amino acid transport system permease subunit